MVSLVNNRWQHLLCEFHYVVSSNRFMAFELSKPKKHQGHIYVIVDNVTLINMMALLS